MGDIVFTEKETKAIVEHNLRADQLRNLRKVMNGSITPKKLKKLEDTVLPGYILRELNARHKAQSIMKKKGFRLK